MKQWSKMCYYYYHSIEEETKAEQGQLICPQSLKNLEPEPELKSRQSVSKISVANLCIVLTSLDGL